MKRIPFALIAVAFACGSAFAQTATSEAPDTTVQQIQTQLAARGYNPGPADGRLTARTVEALRQFQRVHSLAQTGQIDTGTLAALGLNRAREGSGAPPASMVGAGTTAPGATPQGPSPQNTPLAGAPAQGVSLGGSTPPGAPSPSFGATPAGAPSPSFGATPPGMQSPTGTVAGAPAPAATTTTTTTTTSSGAGNSAGARTGR